MKSLPLSNETRTVGIDQPDLQPLSICDINEDGKQYMVSLWQPSTEEIELILSGWPIKLAVLGRRHPPVLLEVQEE